MFQILLLKLTEVWETEIPLPVFWIKSITPQAPKCFAKDKIICNLFACVTYRTDGPVQWFFPLRRWYLVSVVEFLLENFSARIYKEVCHRKFANNPNID